MISQLLMPFSSKHQYLKKYWWHRLLVVVFVVSVFSTGVYVWQTVLHQEVAGYLSCISADITQEYANNTYNQNHFTAEQQQCSSTFPVHALLDFGIGFVAAVITFYFLQLIYYKVILYVVFGNSKT